MTNVEFLIVGNGLAGSLLAFEMLERGLDFRILTAPTKSKASMVAAGMFNPLVFKRMTKSWMADDLMPVMKTKYLELEQKLGRKFFFEKDILKPLSKQELPLWSERKSNVEFSKYIKSVEQDFTFETIREAEAYGIVTQSGYINIAEFIKSSEHFFEYKKYLIEGTFSFDAYQSSPKSYKSGGFNFEKIIFCEGYHMVGNPFLNFLPLRPVKGEVLEIYAPDLSEEYIINKKVFVLPTGKHKFKVGSTYEWQDLHETPTEIGKNSIVSRLNELTSTGYIINNHWAGIRPTVSDRRPILGQHPDFKNLYLFNGLGTKGVMLGPYFATEMVNFLSDTNFSIHNEVQIERFV